MEYAFLEKLASLQSDAYYRALSMTKSKTINPIHKIITTNVPAAERFSAVKQIIESHTPENTRIIHPTTSPSKDGNTFLNGKVTVRYIPDDITAHQGKALSSSRRDRSNPKRATPAFRTVVTAPLGNPSTIAHELQHATHNANYPSRMDNSDTIVPIRDVGGILKGVDNMVATLGVDSSTRNIKFLDKAWYDTTARPFRKAVRTGSLSKKTGDEELNIGKLIQEFDANAAAVKHLRDIGANPKLYNLDTSSIGSSLSSYGIKRYSKATSKEDLEGKARTFFRDMYSSRHHGKKPIIHSKTGDYTWYDRNTEA